MSTQSVGRNGQPCFDLIPGRRVLLGPAAGELTSDAGLLTVQQFDERVGGTARFAWGTLVKPIAVLGGAVMCAAYGFINASYGPAFLASVASSDVARLHASLRACSTGAMAVGLLGVGTVISHIGAPVPERADTSSPELCGISRCRHS